MLPVVVRPRMNGTASAPDIPDVGRTSRCYESEEERQKISELTCCIQEASQLLLEEKQAIARREDLKSKTERGVVIALNALAPIKRLSDDVLCHIFELHCKDSSPVTLPRNHQVWEPAPPQITISHVCSAWREIMLDVPTFWSSIKIVPRNLNTPQTIGMVVKAANTWLSRAKGLPCTIDIDFPKEYEIWDTSHRSLWKKDWHKNIIRDLISLHKFKKLGVTFAGHHLRDLLQLPDDKLSCVEDLCLRYVSQNEDDITSPFDLHKLSNLTSFSLLPNPFGRSYSLSNPSEGYSEFAGIPWHNLRHIHLRVTTPAPFCLDILEHSSAVLETCSLLIAGNLSSPRVPIPLLQLRKLEVVVYSLSIEKEILEFFLLSLRFPNLKSLTFGPSYFPIILEMLLRVRNTSQMQLEELVITVSTLDIDVRNLLTGFPSLRRLELPDDVTFTDEAMMEVGTGSIGVFLEDLTINDPNLDLEKLLQMVKARSRADERDGKQRIEVTDFKFVTLHCNEPADEMEDEVLYLIEEIMESGVDLNVIFADYSDEESELYGFNGDYSDASHDDEATYGDFQLHIEY